MESVLYMWCGYLLSWKKYYFILDDTSLLYCTNKGGQIEGIISLQLINIHVPVDNPVCFNIHTGIQVIYIKALSIQDKVIWVKKINSIIKHRQKSGIFKLQQQIGHKSRKQQVLKRFQQFIKELWISHAKLEGAIQNLSEKNIKNTSLSKSSNLVDQVRRSAAAFKFKATQISKYVQDIVKYLKEEYVKMKPQQFGKQSNQGRSRDQFDLDETQFMSFTQDLPRTNEKNKKLVVSHTYQNQQKRHKNIFADQKIDSSYKRKSFNYNTQKQIELSEYEVTPINQIYKSQNSIKRLLFSENEVFKKIYSDLNTKRQRESLPSKFTLETKFPVLSTLTGALGSNLTKVAFPVTINEPLSMLQKGCEQLYYSQILKSADQAKDPVQKMSYVCAFIVSMLSINQGRLKKPFNPLLGQTFVFDDKERQFFYFSEQVSHHPPVSAMYCHSQNFQYVANSSSDLSFTGKSLKLHSTNKSYVLLNSNGDKYWFNKPTVSINNILFGNVYLQITGQIQVTCDTYSTKGRIVFNQKSWTKQQCSIQGMILKNEKQQAKISGFWNKWVCSKDNLGNQKLLWSKTHRSIPDQYNFNRYTIQLNHLCLSNIKQLPPTDSRFRPDQRILQYRDIDLASKQKHRLQQKQRKRKKQNQQQKKQHQIVWFRKLKHDNQEIYQFLNQKYEEQRWKDDKWQNCLDIFN